jgi:GTPase SAR1 family protein
MEYIKLVFNGSNGIGKTSLLYSYAANYFPNPDEYLPNAFSDNLSPANVICDGKPISVALWDIYYNSDYDNYLRLRSLSYPQADVFLLGFAIDDR